MTLNRLSLRDLATERDQILTKRFDTLLPALMERAGFEAWVVNGREYNEDPVLETMLPGHWLTARRRTTLVFTEGGRRRASISRYPVGDFEPVWDPEEEPDQWAALVKHLDGTTGRIGINVSSSFALADGLTASERHGMVEAMSNSQREQLKSAKDLAIGWLETRLPEEREPFARGVANAHEILRRGLSSEAVTPGETTTDDLTWWLRERVREVGFGEWFHPGVLVQKPGEGPRGPWDGYTDRLIEPGDFLHADFGIITDEGYRTDQQQHAYVLKDGETDAPQGMHGGLKQGNRVQDILMENMTVGRTGNEALRATIEQAEGEGLRPWIYTHPLGVHGHAAGATIGLWDHQEGVPGPGDYPINVNTGWSIELAAIVTIPEWDDQDLYIMLEEDAFLGEDGITFLDGRQETLHLI
jgi:hypothetical protein